jgi:hypothetical protein
MPEPACKREAPLPERARERAALMPERRESGRRPCRSGRGERAALMPEPTCKRKALPPERARGAGGAHAGTDV